VAWNRQHASESPAEAGALDWSIAAMQEVTGRLLRGRGWDRLEALGVITEAVWWVTMVDATLVRYHPGPYNRALSATASAKRGEIEETFAGLRFVRNRMGYHADPADFVQPQEGGRSPDGDPIADWRWRPLPEPALASLPQRGRDWEMTRYLAYQAQLAGHPVGETFRHAVAFLEAAAERSLSPSGNSAQPLFPQFRMHGSAHRPEESASSPP
jgi:hypothetical protein